MNNLSKIITTYAICEFIEYATKDFTNLQEKIQKFSEECELLGGNKDLFVELAVREMSAC
jgi:alpha-D-ribose 1-methylphosphonate 5-phosphate C-P lyase